MKNTLGIVGQGHLSDGVQKGLHSVFLVRFGWGCLSGGAFTVRHVAQREATFSNGDGVPRALSDLKAPTYSELSIPGS
jgi:hypothetical protein